MLIVYSVRYTNIWWLTNLKLKYLFTNLSAINATISTHIFKSSVKKKYILFWTNLTVEENDIHLNVLTENELPIDISKLLQSRHLKENLSHFGFNIHRSDFSFTKIIGFFILKYY